MTGNHLVSAILPGKNDQIPTQDHWNAVSVTRLKGFRETRGGEKKNVE